MFVLKCRIAEALTKDEEFSIVGIDLSSAFDTIYREKLDEILEKKGVEKDVRMMVKLMMRDTSFKVNGRERISTNIGTPQGDALSPLLFCIYMKEALDELMRKGISQERIVYADDCDFLVYGGDEMNMGVIENVLKEFGLKMNSDQGRTVTFGSIGSFENPILHSVSSAI